MVDKARGKVGRSDALAVAAEVCAALDPACTRVVVAGSLRRGKAEVGDVEILYIPRFEDRPVDLFTSAPVAAAEDVIAAMLADGVLAKRPSIKGVYAWGDKNKLAVHVASGIAVDLFATTVENWWNALVCRTGGAESNKRIASRALDRGYRWNVYGPGFTRASDGEVIPMDSEEAVFAFVGLAFERPEDRP